MPSKMIERELARMREAVAERQARDSGAKAWLLREIQLIRARRLARLTTEERVAHDAAQADRHAAARAVGAEELARLAEVAAEAEAHARQTGDAEDTRAAMLARLRAIKARPAPDTER